MKHKRRKYLINPGFQLRFMVFIALAVLICLTTLYISNSVYFNGMTSQGEEIGLDPTHPYYELIEEQRQILNRTYAIVASVMFLLLMWFGLILSHRIAGPLFHISRVLRQVSEDESNPTRVHLRKRDFFKDMEAIINHMIDKYQEEVARQNRESLTYSKDVAAVRAVAGAHMLVVEDNDINLELVTELLTSNGVRVDTASNGQEALDKLLQGVYFDGILMDGQMPVMDGYAATEAIRKLDLWREIPIVAMTASVMAADRQRALDAGMNDYVPKPINVSALFSTLARHVKPLNAVYRTQSGLALSQQNAMLIPAIEGIDIEEGLRRTQQDWELYQRLLDRFAASQRDFRHRFTNALETEGVKGAERVAHSLTGVAGNIGATSLYGQAKLLERACRDENDPNEIEQRLIGLVDELGRLLDNLESAFKESAEWEPLPPMSPAEQQLAVSELRRLIAENDTAALGAIESLQSRMPVEEAAALMHVSSAVKAYDFDNAINLLDEWNKS